MEVFCSEKNFIRYPRINDVNRYVIEHCSTCREWRSKCQSPYGID